MSPTTASALQRAQALELPSRTSTLHRETSVAQFWEQHRQLLSAAWAEWEAEHAEHLPTLPEELISAPLREAVGAAWEDPRTEASVAKLWEPVSPGVFQCQFFDPQRIGDVRDYLNAAFNAQIPLRPPYGIVLNRRGAMLDPRSTGFLAGPEFQAFYRRLLDRYMRPISRLLFPEVTGFDTQSFGFSIEYRPSTDTSIRPHTDASATTLNINLNLPGESFKGSVVDFFNPNTGKAHEFIFAPGVAALHRGRAAHAARPITSGERTNFVLWLYGEHGQMPARSSSPVTADATERWTVPNVPQDTFAPF